MFFTCWSLCNLVIVPLLVIQESVERCWTEEAIIFCLYHLEIVFCTVIE